MNLEADHLDHSVETEPGYAQVLFGERTEIARGYVSILVRDSERLGLLGPREFPKIWSRHVAHCALLGELIAAPEGVTGAAQADINTDAQRIHHEGRSSVHAHNDIVDIGSGAGLPGIPLAIAMPDRHLTLLEPMERRADWLRSTIAELGIMNADVVRQRAEDHDGQYLVATARAVAPLRKLVALVAPLLSGEEDAAMIFIKGRSVEQEIADAAKVIQKAKMGSPEVFILGRELQAEPLTAVRISRSK